MAVDNDSTQAVALGDVDGDGDLDMVLGNGGYSLQQQNRLYLNNGAGTFSDATTSRLPVGIDYTTSLALGDVDGDGDVDLVIGNHRQQNRLYLNNGTGTFTDATANRMPMDMDWTTSVAVGDVDGDGDLDLLVGNWGYSRSQTRLYLNGGMGTFSDATSSRMPVDNDFTASLAVGDVDSDGDLDLVVGNDYGAGSVQDRLYLNDGNGTFTDATAARMPTRRDTTKAVALGDVDSDGDLDLVVGNQYGTAKIRLYLNDGTGTFTDATASRMPVAPVDFTFSVVLGDVDGDGDLDLVTGNSPLCYRYYCYGGENQLYINDGTGTFADATASRMPVRRGFTKSVALGDVDGDSDLDMAFGNAGPRGEQNSLYLNLLRQLDAPSPARTGQTYTLDVHARYGVPRLVDVALPYVSSATARIPLPPFGTVGIDPAFMVPLSPFVIPQPAGMGSVTGTIPNNSSLVGLSLHGQALLLQWPTAAFLTNVTSDRIVR